MTSKERITVALRGGTPDRVPVTLGLSEMVPVRYFSVIHTTKGDLTGQYYLARKTCLSCQEPYVKSPADDGAKVLELLRNPNTKDFTAIRQALLITADMGVDGFDALESPPTGNVDLAEVKRAFPTKSLRGNVNSITVMLHGTPVDVERDVQRCLDAAKDGGGYILGVGDQTPYATPEENLRVFVEAGLKYGAYRGVR